AVKLVELESIEIEPEVVVLGTGDAVSFHVGAKADGKKVELSEGMLEVLSGDENIAKLEDGNIVASAKGETKLDVIIGSASRAVPVYVDLAEGRMLEDFETADAIHPIDGTVYDNEATT